MNELNQILPAGTRVRILAMRSAPGTGLTYPAMAVAELVEDCTPGGWDVVDVFDADCNNVSVYSFSVERLTVEQELRAVIRDGVEQVQHAYDLFRIRGCQWWVEGEQFLERAQSMGVAVDPGYITG